MSRKTSTAALDTSSQRPLQTSRRVPRRPAGESLGLRRPTTQYVTQISQAQLAISQEDRMNGTNQKREPRNFRSILPVILRITCSLILWTLGATMTISAAQAGERREVTNFPIDRTHLEALQRWVNSGHDEWCRDPEFVASAAIRRISPEFSDSGMALVSLPLETEHARVTRVVYTYHSLEGRTTYRVTVRRFRWLLPTAGTFQQMIWVPERAEVITRDTLEKPVAQKFH